MKKLYAILTNQCNLSCDHCFIRNAPEVYQKEQFLSQIKNFDGWNIVLFGGEPTLYEDRLFDVIEVVKEKKSPTLLSITTNLMKLNDRILDFYRNLGGVGTSWNISRFSETQYKQWLINLDRFEEYHLQADVLITLTKDLIETPIDEFISIINKWNPKVIRTIKFEQYIGDDAKVDLYKKSDNWLCELYKKKDQLLIDVAIFHKEYRWYFDCTQTYSLTPGGNLHHGCPNGLYINRSIPTECFTCSNSNICRPCILQQYCTRPNKLRSMIESEE